MNNKSIIPDLLNLYQIEKEIHHCPACDGKLKVIAATDVELECICTNCKTLQSVYLK